MSERLSISLDEALAASVHDIKNIMGWLSGSVYLLQDALGEGSEHADLIIRMQYEMNLLKVHLDQLLGLHKASSRGLSWFLDYENVQDFLDQVLSIYRPYFEVRGIDLVVSCDTSLNWYFDARLLRIVIENAIYNAVRYLDRVLGITVDASDSALRIQIWDDGPGFGDVEASANDRGVSGFGLVLSRYIVEGHTNGNRRGELHCGNRCAEDGGGAQVEIYLP